MMGNIKLNFYGKNHPFIVILIICLGLFWSCSLKDEIFDEVTPETFYETKEEFDAGLAAIFHSYFNGFVFQAQWMNVGDDEMTSNFNEIGEADKHNIVSTNYSSYEVTWTSLWSSVAAANSVLGGVIDKGEGLEESTRDEIRGQALFGRGLAYFFLVRWWGDVPIVKEGMQAEEITALNRSPVSEVYELIISDLETAADLLPPSFGQRGRPTKGAANAILAEAYLTMGGWPLNDSEMYAKARDAALEVLESNQYELEVNFGDLWKLSGEDSNEYIFQLEAIGTAGFSNWVIDKRPSEDGGWENYIVELSYYEEFPEGKRKEATFYTVSKSGVPYTEWSIETPTIGKYNDRDASGISDPATGQFNIPFTRLARVMLIYAEAQNLADGGPNSRSVDYLNQIRKRGNDNFVSASVNDFDELSFDKVIVDERHWELGFEYSRWFDMIRKELLPNEVTKEHYYMPIPDAELSVVDWE